jgi:predicted AlkP superfamily pyrophosphatase or phosphodiesterase
VNQWILRPAIPALLGGLFLLPALSSAAATRGKGSAPGAVPKLVVLISVDQMRADYLGRFEAFFGDKGFRRLSREGRVFSRAGYSHATTMTGPGHALIGSGIYADRSGIVENRWYSYDPAGEIYCASGIYREGSPGTCAPEDLAEKEAPGWKRGLSPCAFGGKSLAERVKERYPEARVVGVSIKDRSAILMAGKKADAAYWVEVRKDHTGAVACTDYYPGCRREVLAFGDDEGLGEKPAAPESTTLFRKHPSWREWTWSLPAAPESVCPDDLPEAHADAAGVGKRLPHPVRSVEALVYTPFGNDLLESLAEKVVGVHALGANPRREPDVLAVGFSSTDYFGHLFGPDSCEAADGMVRLDAALGRLLDFLAARVGKENLVVFLTADHGVAPLPEVSLKKGIPAGRLDLHATVDRAKGTIGDLPPIRQRMESFLARELGTGVNAATPLSQAYVVAYYEPNLYLNRERIGEKTLPFARARMREYLRRMEGVSEVYTWDQAQAGEAPESVLRSFRKDRSGDLILLLQPYWIPVGLEDGTDHGQSYDYDSRVPLIAWGREIAPGVEKGSVDVAQIAPTLAAILGLDATGFSIPSPLPLGNGGPPRPR